METGYSRLLIHEFIIPAVNAHWEATSLDICMMALLGSQERTLEEWTALLSKVGLTIKRIWSTSSASQSLIECEVPFIGL